MGNARRLKLALLVLRTQAMRHGLLALVLLFTALPQADAARHGTAQAKKHTRTRFASGKAHATRKGGKRRFVKRRSSLRSPRITTAKNRHRFTKRPYHPHTKAQAVPLSKLNAAIMRSRSRL